MRKEVSDMKNPSEHSTTNEIKKRVPMILSLLILAGMILLNVCVREPVTEPDSVHPMANAAVSWSQTFHSGAWGGAE